MRLAIGSDPAGYELKLWLIEHLRQNGLQVDDLGCPSLERADYLHYAALVGRGVAAGE